MGLGGRNRRSSGKAGAIAAAAAAANNNNNSSPSNSKTNAASEQAKPQPPKKNRWFGGGRNNNKDKKTAEPQARQEQEAATQGRRRNSKEPRQNSLRNSGGKRGSGATTPSETVSTAQSVLDDLNGLEEQKQLQDERARHSSPARRNSNNNNNNTIMDTLETPPRHNKSSTNNNNNKPKSSSTRHLAKSSLAPTSPLSPQNLSAARAILNRPFGRPAYWQAQLTGPAAVRSPPHTGNHSARLFYTCRVSPPGEWDESDNPPQALLRHQSMYYRITLSSSPSLAAAMVTHDVDHNSHHGEDDSDPEQKQQQIAVTWRSRADLQWLREHLHLEYQGSLLVPDFPKPGLESYDDQEPPPPEQVKEWLSDICNGLRGQGEWILPETTVSAVENSINSHHQFHHNNGAMQQTTLSLVESSQAIEAFFYKSGPLAADGGLDGGVASTIEEEDEEEEEENSGSQSRNRQVRDGDSISEEYGGSHHLTDNESTSFVQNVWCKSLEIFPQFGEFCVGQVPDPVSDSSSPSSKMRGKNNDNASEPVDLDATPQMSGNHRKSLSNRNGGKNGALMKHGGDDRRELAAANSRRRFLQEMSKRLPYSSRALGSATSLEILDSFADNESLASATSLRSRLPLSQQFPHHHPQLSSSNGLAIHSELMEAEKDLLLNFRQTATGTLQASHELQKGEERVGLAWKRLAVALANLFAHEKHAETAKLGETLKVKKENLLYRKLDKRAVDDGLRILAMNKSNRCLPSLEILQAMVSAYLNDLTAVEPSVEAYSTAIHTTLAFTNAYEQDDAKDAASPKTKSAKAQTHNLIKQRVLCLERDLCQSLTHLCKETSTRTARIAYWYMKTEAAQCAALHSAASSFRSKILNHSSVAPAKDAVSKLTKRHWEATKKDNATELVVVQRILDLRKRNHKYLHLVATANQEVTLQEGSGKLAISPSLSSIMDEEDDDSEGSAMRERALHSVQKRLGRWDAKASADILEATIGSKPKKGKESTEIFNESVMVKMKDATKEMKLINQYSEGLQESLDRISEAIGYIRKVVLTSSTSQEDESSEAKATIRNLRVSFAAETAKLLSAKFIPHQLLNNEEEEDDDGIQSRQPKRSAMPSMSILDRAGIDVTDSYGWATAYDKKNMDQSMKGWQTSSSGPGSKMGDLWLSYLNSKDSRTESILKALEDLLQDYQQRLETVEGYIYMECVGIRLEKFFNEKRTLALTSFERKTDLTSAMNVATKKRLPHLVKEIQGKLDTLEDVSHTVVKETKELHLESKAIKSELHELAVRRLLRARETSTEKAIALMSAWAKEEESLSTRELKLLGEAVSVLEKKFEAKYPGRPPA